jgi:hypothetical protein
MGPWHPRSPTVSSWRDPDRRRQYLLDNPEQAEKARERARVASARKRAADPGYQHRARFYAELVEWQGSELCAICGDPPPTGKRQHVDHDHTTDEVRGLLCGRCNGAIGRTREVSQWLHNAIAYLDREKYTGISFEEVRRANAHYGTIKKRDAA